jgi:hypothetical protein
MRNVVDLAIVAVLLCFISGDSAAQSAGVETTRDAWLADYAYLKTELEHRYSHLAWLASPQGGVDLPALDRSTRNALEKATSDADALGAITAFVAGFHDGHFAQTARPKSPSPSSGEPPAVDFSSDARTACAAFGYAPVTRISFSLPFEALPGFTLVSDGRTSAFRTGVAAVDGRRIGILRIPRFRPAEFPDICERAWTSLKGRHVAPTRERVLDSVDAEWLHTLAARLHELRRKEVVALVVDVGGNGGGNDLGDWAVRLFTSTPVHSAPLLLAASPVAIPYFDEQLAGLQHALDEVPGVSPNTRSALERALDFFRRGKQEASSASCDMSWVWREQRAWGNAPCTRLIAAGFASGPLDYAAPGSLDARVERVLYWPAIADSLRAAWTGPVYILTDQNTGSAAEMFTALMRDRGIAKTVGARTFGLGCGFIDNDDPVVLPNSGYAFRMPNCVRLRANGTDEIAGIAPDFPMIAEPGETSRSVAARTLRTISGNLPARAPQP